MTRRVQGGQPTHGARLFWSKGILPKYRRALADGADSIIAAIRADLGGDTTATQEVLLGQLRKCMIFQALIDKWLTTQKEFVSDKGELPPCLSGFYLSVVNTSIRISLELGLQRKAHGDDLESYLRKKAAGSPIEAQTPPAPSPRQGKRGSKVCARSEGQGGNE